MFLHLFQVRLVSRHSRITTRRGRKMKRTAVSIISLAALASAGAAHAQSSVTLYGTIDTSLTYVHNAQGNNNLWALGNSSAGNLSGTRWGLKGSEDLGSGLK